MKRHYQRPYRPSLRDAVQGMAELTALSFPNEAALVRQSEITVDGWMLEFFNDPQSGGLFVKASAYGQVRWFFQEAHESCPF